MRSNFVLALGVVLASVLVFAELSGKEREDNMGIVLVPVGKVEGEVFEHLKGDLLQTFDKPVSMGRPMPEPHDAFNPERVQYLSTAILRALLDRREYLGYEKILGIVDYDLYVPELNFVFGEASRRAAIISVTRLRQAFYHLPEDHVLFRRRVFTEAVHELGHTYGLGHCKSPHCVMFFSNSLGDTDRKGPEFCGICKKRLLREK